MDLNFKILVFGAQWNAETAHMGNLLRFMFKGHLPVGKEIGYYESIAEALPEFTNRFQGTDVVLLLADVNDYAHIKDLLTKALHVPLRSSPEIAKHTRITIGDFAPGSDEMIAHCSVPEGKQAFCMGDGLYAGFAITAGRQNMIFLPHDTQHTVPLLNQQVIPYLNEFYGETLPTDASLRYYADELCALLDENGERMGVSGTKTSLFIRNAVQHIPNATALLRFTPNAETRGSVPPFDYATNLSIAACELEGCPYGAAMTNAFFAGNEATADTEKSVYIAFTDDSDTLVRTVHSFAGEELEAFLNRCTEELFRFAIERIRIMHDLSVAQQSEKPKKAVSNGKKTVMALVAVIAVLASFAISYFATGRILQSRTQADQSDLTEQATEEQVTEAAQAEPTSELPTEKELPTAEELPTEELPVDLDAAENTAGTVIDLDLQ